MIWAGVLAGAFAGGLLLVVRGLVPRPRPLAVLAAELVRPRELEVHAGDRVGARWARLAGRLGGRPSPAKTADLAILHRTPARHTMDQLGYAAVFFVFAVMALAALPLAGVPVPTVAGPTGALAFSAVGWLWPEVDLRSRARAARRAWSQALTVYVDIVGISLAGGAGVEEALSVAARTGSGPQFQELAETLRTAQTRRQRPWDAMGELGASADIPALRELAAAVELAAESGSRIRESLIAKAASMRVRQLTEAEADAQKASETLGTAPALLAVAAVVLIGYPAVARFFE